MGQVTRSRRHRTGKVSYFGIRERGAARVFHYWPGRDPSEGAPLDLRPDLRKHSPAGSEWGYAGSGPAQLALAILADYLGSDEEALELYQEFKTAVIAQLPEGNWILGEQEIAQALAGLRLRRAGLEVR